MASSPRTGHQAGSSTKQQAEFPPVDVNDITSPTQRWLAIQTQLEALEDNILSHRGRSHRNVLLLQQAAALARFLDAGRITICKSAKVRYDVTGCVHGRFVWSLRVVHFTGYWWSLTHDELLQCPDLVMPPCPQDRTSMSVTLEQSRLLRDRTAAACPQCVASGMPIPDAIDAAGTRLPSAADDGADAADDDGLEHVGGGGGKGGRAGTEDDDLVLEHHNAHLVRMQQGQELQESVAAVMRTNGVRRENAYVCVLLLLSSSLLLMVVWWWWSLSLVRRLADIPL